MALEEFPAFIYTPRMPSLNSLDPRVITVVYEQTSDTLFMNFYGESRPAISLAIDGDIYLRVDPETESVVGIQVEHFLSRVVREQPKLLLLAEFAGIPSSLIEEARAGIDPIKLRASALESIFRDLVPVE